MNQTKVMTHKFSFISIDHFTFHNLGRLNNMVCGVKTLNIIFIVAYCSVTVPAFDGCSAKYYGELYNKKKMSFSFKVQSCKASFFVKINSYLRYIFKLALSLPEERSF